MARRLNSWDGQVGLTEGMKRSEGGGAFMEGITMMIEKTATVGY